MAGNFIHKKRYTLSDLFSIFFMCKFIFSNYVECVEFTISDRAPGWRRRVSIRFPLNRSFLKITSYSYLKDFKEECRRQNKNVPSTTFYYEQFMILITCSKILRKYETEMQQRYVQEYNESKNIIFLYLSTFPALCNGARKLFLKS